MTKAMASGENPGHQSLTSEIIRKNRGTTTLMKSFGFPARSATPAALWRLSGKPGLALVPLLHFQSKLCNLSTCLNAYPIGANRSFRGGHF